ncbi:MAG: hypothetical protein WA726_04965 [Acidimicrobiia bacterium]
MSSTSRRVISVAIGLVTLVVSVLLFATFDRDSHSASDTLRPFLLTVVPVWLIAYLAVRFVVGDRRSKDR